MRWHCWGERLRSKHVPRADYRPPPGLASVAGVLLAVAELCPRAADVFTPEEMEERIVAHRRRIVREFPESQLTPPLRRMLDGGAP